MLFILEIASIHLSTLEIKKNEINYKPTYTSSLLTGNGNEENPKLLKSVSHKAVVKKSNCSCLLFTTV